MLRILFLFAVLLLISPQATNLQGGGRNKNTRIEQQQIRLKSSGDPWGCWIDEADYPNAKLAIPPLVVSPDRLLVTACDTLYMLNSAGDVLWQWSTGGPGITAQPFVDPTGIVHVIAFDLIWVGLDANTGELKWNLGGSNTKVAYMQMKPYKDDQYLVVIDFSFYRHGEIDSIWKDNLVLCKGQDVLAEADFPSDAILEVWGEKILAVTNKPEHVEIQEIRLNNETANKK